MDLHDCLITAWLVHLRIFPYRASSQQCKIGFVARVRAFGALNTVRAFQRVISHKAIHCRSKTKCPTCSGNHTHSECVAQGRNEERRVVCPNCRGNHPAYHRDCRFFQEVKNIKTIQVKNQVSYAEAAKTFRNNTNSEHNNPNSVLPTTSTSATTNGIEPATQDNTTGEAEIIKGGKYSSEKLIDRENPPELFQHGSPCEPCQINWPSNTRNERKHETRINRKTL